MMGLGAARALGSIGFVQQGSLRILGTSALLGVALLLQRQGNADLAEYTIIVAVAISVLGTAYEFWRRRDHYLDGSKRDSRESNALSAESAPM